MRTSVVVVAAVLVGSPAALYGQLDSVGVPWTIAPFVGLAAHSPVGNSWGVTPDRAHLFVGGQFEAPVLRLGTLALLFAPSVSALRLTHTPAAGSGVPKQPTAYGLGFAPFGLAVRTRSSRRVATFASAAIGGVWFSRSTPVPDARAFNVTVEWGGGVDLRVRSRSQLRIGYKFHHLSNVFTAPQNPGVDGNVFYAGWRRGIGRRH